MAVVAAFVVSVFLLFFRVGRQVRGGEPVALSLVGSIPVVPPGLPPQMTLPPDGGAPTVSTGVDGAAPSVSVGAPGVRSRPTREVFRKPGF
jgi:hypothetical protein